MSELIKRVLERDNIRSELLNYELKEADDYEGVRNMFIKRLCNNIQDAPQSGLDILISSFIKDARRLYDINDDEIKDIIRDMADTLDFKSKELRKAISRI